MSKPTTSLSLIAFDTIAADWDLFEVDDCAAGVLAHLSNAETICGGEMSLPLIDRSGDGPMLKIDRDQSQPRRIAG